ncbi:MAG: sulfotransferase [Bacteroidetes bacterium]|nr:sulfotransferase [Bacteroidota bacterium]
MSNKNFSKRPLLFRGINSVWESTYFLGSRIKLDKDILISKARKITGLSDLGKDFWDEPVERMIDSINGEANLNPIGRFITRERLTSLISIRLRAEYFFKKYPEILEQELYPAWIIVGLQRTGTTKLHRLLAVDPNHRVIPSWEVINPMPLNLDFRPSGVHEDLKRMKVARTSVKAVELMSPGFFAIHPIDAIQPEEDILMLDVSFLSTTTEAMMDVPSYAAWLEQTDQSPAYEYAVKLMKFLQWVKPAKRWVLKTPHHLEFPHLITKYFNDVKFIWPHRNIYESVPSYLSMLTYNYMMFSDDVDEQKIAAHWVRKTGYMLEQAFKFRLKGNNNDKFLDIYYKDLLRDSMKELGRIYSMDGGLNPALVESFRQHELDHPHRKHGVHQYSLVDFGLTEADIDHHTTHYQDFIKDHYGRK